MIRFDWSYDDDLLDGRRLIAIHQHGPDHGSIDAHLDRRTSQLLFATLRALAEEPGVAWRMSRQACLRAFHETCSDPEWMTNDPPRPQSGLPTPPVRVVRKGWLGTRECTMPIGHVERMNDERRWRRRRPRWWRRPVPDPEPVTALTTTDSEASP